MSASLLLASKSAVRRMVLEGAGLTLATVDSELDEAAAKSALIANGADPRTIAAALAEQKAIRVSEAGRAFVIGADQTLEFEGVLYDKATSLDEARARLRSLRGKPHQLHSAIAIAKNGVIVWRELVTATLTMREFSDAFLESYLAQEGSAALGSVGCYRLEGPGAQLFSDVQGDYFTILGMPLFGLLEFLRQKGVLLS